MSITIHERPGVYSSFDASSAVRGRQGRKTVGLVAINANTTAEALKAVTVTSVEQAIMLFGAEPMTELIGLILRNGAAAVVAVPITSVADYQAGIDKLSEVDDISISLCDSMDILVQQNLKTAMELCASQHRERIVVVVGGVVDGVAENVTELVARSESLNSERVVLVANGGATDEKSSHLLAAAVAGAMAGESDPAMPLGGVELDGVASIVKRYNDNEIDLLIRGGITPVEERSGAVSIVRGVTTRTKSGSVPDTTWRELSTILIVDHVIPDIRNGLRAKFKRAKNTAQSQGAIRAQVVMALENHVRSEIISAYDGVMVEADENDPTICRVTFSFTVAHSLNQIWIRVHVTV